MGLFARRRGLGRFAALWVLAALLGLWRYEHEPSFGQGTKSAEDALRARVQELYSCLQEGNWAKAETYLTEDSREIFRHQDRQQLAGFEIKSIKLEKEDRAEVVVAVPTSGPLAPRPFSVPQTTSWRVVGGVWYAQLSQPNANPTATLFTAPRNPTPTRPVLHELKFGTTWFGLGYIKPGQTKVARFPFTNASKHAVTIAEVISGCDCLRVKEDHKEYKPGESGVLEIEFDPSSPSLRVPQSLTVTVVVRSSPGGGLTKLTLSGMVPPPSDQQ